ncbi:MAG: acetyl-CoA carboxylase carboxyl transferase subunit beta [Candidatus Omnitrophica bacterium CG11_big_fil_rev_8_21_14_0_20_42_13]|uniref:Acetyl-coenzyme A carboxylase carboxyl transferase subunit beta n=1 Tax=Candidatus Ghiorseimicrobium undicola TaxID=1974746 RepID=A0A2H0LVE2_9BACT|nr:MAG: acetyl-CoA carboxylase carboxyl transferase subunit beta [Candidatus Omnitrophica bacterium CG11_big_fil_rev_8_21_14_0_20_42_13]
MTMSLFGKPKYTIVRTKKKQMPDGLWTKCQDCLQPIYNKTLDENLKVCPECGYHFSLTAYERILSLADGGRFEEFDKNVESLDPLEFKGPKTYKEKLEQDKELTGLSEACIYGQAKLSSYAVVLTATDSRFIMGSMGSVVGDKVTRSIEYATRKGLPIIIISGSGGGARMYEGMFSLMQMAKTSAALARHQGKGLLYISILTNPTMAGVMASFAGLGDIIIAEPKALIGFAGPRVIEQTIRQKLPDGFQKAEFLLEHGLIDMIVQRKNLKTILSQLLDYLT